MFEQVYPLPAIRELPFRAIPGIWPHAITDDPLKPGKIPNLPISSRGAAAAAKEPAP
jgi:hypothetical protein